MSSATNNNPYSLLPTFYYPPYSPYQNQTQPTFYYPPYSPYQNQTQNDQEQNDQNQTQVLYYLYDQEQIQPDAAPPPYSHQQPSSFNTPSSSLPSQSLSSNSVEAPPSASPQKRTQMTIDSKDISNAYLENLAEKFPNLEKLIITFWDTSYTIQSIAHQSEAISQIKTNSDTSTQEHTDLLFDSQDLSNDYLTTLVQTCLNLGKLIITNPFTNKKIDYSICQRRRVFKSVPKQPIQEPIQPVDALAKELQALQLNTPTPSPVTSPMLQDIKENKPPQPVAIKVETEEEKRLKKREKLLHKINTYTKERLSPEHLKNSPSLLRSMFGHPRSHILRFFLDPEVFLDKTVKEFKEPSVYNLLTCCKTLYPVWKIYVEVLKNALPKSICFKPPVNIEQLASIARNAALKGLNKTYKTQYSSQESIAITETTLQSFTTLDMRRYEALESNPNWLQPFIKFYPNVTRLHLPFFKFNEDYGKQIQKFPKLKEFDMSLCISKDGDGLKYLPQLTHLYNQYPYEQSHTVIPFLENEKTPTSLDSKEENFIETLSPEEFDSITKETKKIQQLAVRKNPTEIRLNNSKHSLFKFNLETAKVFKHLANLQVLNLGSAPTITKKTLDLISKSKDLQELYIFNAYQISDTDLESLAKLKLKKFSIVGWKKITDDGIEKIFELFPQLTELWIGNNQITTYSMKFLVVHSKKEKSLRTVYVRQPLSIEKTEKEEYCDIWKNNQNLIVHLPVHI